MQSNPRKKLEVQQRQGKTKAQVCALYEIAYLLTSDGIKPDPSKTGTIKSMPIPTSVGDIQYGS